MVLAIGDDGIFLLGACLAAWRTGRPLIVFLLDIYAGNNFSALKRGLARLIEPSVLRFASRVLVTNESAHARYLRQYGLDCTIIHHPVPIAHRPVLHDVGSAATVTYTGTVYWAQLDALQNLVAALKRLPAVSLELVSETALADLAAMGLRGAQVRPNRLTAELAQDRQRRADILFLPLAFRSRSQDVIRTASPGKMAEYLVTGVPILVHAPSDSYVAEDARRHGWGLVVDELNEQALAAAVEVLLKDTGLRARLIESAFEIARARHDEVQVREVFRSCFDLSTVNALPRSSR